jgi:hypothetical protein
MRTTCVKGVEKMAYVVYWSVVTHRDLIFRHSLCNVFPFLPSKTKLIGDVPKNRQNAANRFAAFLTFEKQLTSKKAK